MAERQRSIVQARLTPEDRERVKIAAKRERRTVSAWLRALVLDALDGLDAEPMKLTERDRRRGGKVSGAPCCVHLRAVLD